MRARSAAPNRIRKGPRWLKATLVQCGLGGGQEDSYFHAQYYHRSCASSALVWRILCPTRRAGLKAHEAAGEFSDANLELRARHAFAHNDDTALGEADHMKCILTRMVKRRRPDFLRN
jgi:hypothetical protein